jgi:hypothetical protein
MIWVVPRTWVILADNLIWSIQSWCILRTCRAGGWARLKVFGIPARSTRILHPGPTRSLRSCASSFSFYMIIQITCVVLHSDSKC